MQVQSQYPDHCYPDTADSNTKTRQKTRATPPRKTDLHWLKARVAPEKMNRLLSGQARQQRFTFSLLEIRRRAETLASLQQAVADVLSAPQAVAQKFPGIFCGYRLAARSIANAAVVLVQDHQLKVVPARKTRITT